MNQTEISIVKSYFIWFLMTLFVAYNYFLKASYGAIIENVSKNLNINYAQAGLLSSVFFYVYAGVQLIIGLILTHFSMRKIVTSSILLCAIGTLVFAWTTNFTVALIARVMMGIGTAFSFTSTVFLIGKIFPTVRYTLMIGLTNGIANLCGSGFGVLVFVTSGYSDYFMKAIGVMGILLAVFIWFSIPKIFKGKEKTTSAIGIYSIMRVFGSEFLSVISSVKIWSIALYGGIMLGVFIAFGNLWNIPFQRATGLSMEYASFMNLLVILGMASGSAIIGWFSDFIQKRILLAFLSTIGALIVISCILYIPNMPVFSKYLSLFCFGFFCGSVCLSYAMVNDYIPKHIHGVGIGFVTALTSLIGGSLQYIIGQILLNLKQTVVGGTFTVLQYQKALTVIPFVLCLALVLLLITKNLVRV